jgi:AraC family transcriptional regulator of adaptative response/methylated-DNA-[protein]-cysteine methyltransferase
MGSRNERDPELKSSGLPPQCLQMPPPPITPELHLATPEQIRNRGAGMIIGAGTASSPFGDCLIARCRHGFCQFAFIGESGDADSLQQMHARWPLAEVERDDTLAAVWSEMLFSTRQQDPREIPLFVAATPFQAAVWRVLLQVPCGARITYSALAAAAGHPGANRATGTAVGANPLAWLIPCHRVIRADGQTGNYRWGADRKRAMLAWEAA